MAGPSVLESPKSYDYFTLDGEVSPGLAKIVGGGDAKEKIQDQQQPLSTGANTVVWLSENAVITYELRLWLPGHFDAWARWEAMFLEGRKRRPPRVYAYQDLGVGWIGRVVFEAMSPQRPEKPGGPWTRTLVLHQYNRAQPYGGPIQPPVSAQGKKNEELSARNAAKAQALAAAEAAAKAAGKAGK